MFRNVIVGILSLLLSFSCYAGNNYQDVVDQAYSKYKADYNGKIADYIPELKKYKKDNFAIALVTVDGKVYSAGDTNLQYPIESVMKIFSIAYILELYGSDAVEQNIGVNATGMPFNSALAIEINKNHSAGNPLVNAGAIASLSLLKGSSTDSWNNMMAYFNKYANDQLHLDNAVYISETKTNQHNQAIAQLLYSYGKMKPGANTKQVLDLYTKLCSISVSTLDLAKMGAVFANQGKSPVTGEQLLKPDYNSKVLALMSTAGVYDDTGSWMYNIGIPAKSGVSGDIVAVVPHKFAVVAYSPLLDEQGNSIRGTLAIKYIANALGANIYN
jgi:glutaminase